MANPAVIVSRRVRLEAPPEREAEALRSASGLEVTIDDGRRLRLDPADPRAMGYAQVLRGLEQLGKPAYFEIDLETAVVRRLLIPTVGFVRAARDAPEGVEVELELSHARLLLLRDQDRSAEFAGVLREALAARRPVALTADDAQHVIDVRFFEPGPDDGPLPKFPFEPLPLRWWPKFVRWPLWPWNWWPLGCISPQRAQQAFDAMSATSCNPLTVPPPCITFMYPDDGCYARAHEMCRLMIAMGLTPRKVWNWGSLHTPTRNSPACAVGWRYHVAPTLCVRRLGVWWFWPLTRETMVIDPALFTTPVSTSVWKAIQGDPASTLTYTDASDYYGGSTDPTYAQTNAALAEFRLYLQLRAINEGPPPYAHCP
jgi:hypothetical protein